MVMGIKQTMKWFEDRLAWTAKEEMPTRVFAVPPEWSKWFYGRPFVQAHACVKSGGEGNPQAMAYVKVDSIRDHNIEFQGPWESPAKAQRRLGMLLENLSGPHVPSLEELLSLSGKCGCSVEVW